MFYFPLNPEWKNGLLVIYTAVGLFKYEGDFDFAGAISSYPN